MARKVVWLPAALLDLDSIWNHIARDSKYYASTTIAKLVRSAKDLARFPGLGRVVPEWGDETIRERIVKSYRLIYEVERARIVVLGVIHGARLLPEDVRHRRRQ